MGGGEANYLRQRQFGVVRDVTIGHKTEAVLLDQVLHGRDVVGVFVVLLGQSGHFLPAHLPHQ